MRQEQHDRMTNSKNWASPKRFLDGVSGKFSELWVRFLGWGLDYEGSTRTAAIIRIGLGFLLWVRYANDLLPFKHPFGLETVFCLTFFGLTTWMIVGLWAQLATFLTGLFGLFTYYYVGHVYGHEPYTHHHIYWLGIATFYCALTPCGRSFSVDRWLAIRKANKARATPPPERGNLFGLRLIVLQLSAMYFWTAYDKTFWGFLSGDRLQQIFVHYYVGSDAGLWMKYGFVFTAAAIFVTLLEYALAFGLPFAKTRRWLLIPGLLMHATFYIMLPVATYSATIILLYLAFLDADRVHRFIDQLVGNDRVSTAA
jgi:hypothetical protein